MKPGYKILFALLGIVLVAAIAWGAVKLLSPAAGAPPTPTNEPSTPTPEPPQAKEPPPPARPEFKLQLTESTVTALPANLQALVPNDLTACLVDAADGRIIWHHRADELVPIASMTKMMTTIVALDEINRRDELTLDTGVKITQAAMDIGGSQVYLGKDEIFTLRELLQAVMIHSANDCAYAIAEATGPDFNVTNFVALMNRTAREIGLAQTRFFNVHGLPESDPDRDCRSTSYELAVLARHCMEYPDLMKWSGTWHHPFRPAAETPLIMQNRNALINTCPGVNGLKTGYIRRSGFCVTVTCTRNGRTLIAVVTGFPASKDRNNFVSQLLDWGFAQ